MTRVPGPPREDEAELPRYDEPLYRQDADAAPRYRDIATEGYTSTCSVCAAVVCGPDGQRQHTEYHRLLGGGLQALVEVARIRR